MVPPGIHPSLKTESNFLRFLFSMSSEVSMVNRCACTSPVAGDGYVVIEYGSPNTLVMYLVVD
jgi:hypothetical protein